jgi:hypothetical protein
MKIDREELRKLVREALKEALGGSVPKRAPPPPRSQAAAPATSARPEGGFVATLRAALARGRPARIPVPVGSSADLDRFARDIAGASSHPDLKAAIAAGDLGFDLAGGQAVAQGGLAAGARPASTGGAYEMKNGVLSETKIVEIARGHRRILIGADVVLTPLARDKAREMRIELTRQKP